MQNIVLTNEEAEVLRDLLRGQDEAHERVDAGPPDALAVDDVLREAHLGLVRVGGDGRGAVVRVDDQQVDGVGTDVEDS